MGQILSTGWQQEHSDKLVECISDGLTYSQATVVINEKFGTAYTRNAAIGRLNRLGLKCPARLKCEPKKREYKYTPLVRIPKHQPKLRCSEIIPGTLSLVDLEIDECRYPFGDGTLASPYLFCGRPQYSGFSYCEYHAALTLRAA